MDFLVLVSLPALVSLILYAGTLTNELVYDDVRVLETAAGTWRPLWTYLIGLGRGFTYLTYRMDLFLWHSWVPGFHLTNITLNALCASMAALAALALSGRYRLALLTGILFAVHPVHVEAVASVGYRKDLLAMLFVAGSLILYLNRRGPFLSYAGAVVCFVLGMLSKEVATVGLVIMLPLAGLLPLRDGRPALTKRSVLLRLAPFLLAGIVAAMAAHREAVRVFTPDEIVRLTEGECRSYPQVLAASMGAIPDLTGLLLFPARLSADYPVEHNHGRTVAGVAIVLLASTAALWFLRRSPLVAFGLFWIVFMYLPCSNVVPLTRFFVAERYLYVPSFGFCLVLAYQLDRFASRSMVPERSGLSRLAWIALFAALTGVAGIRVFTRNKEWRDELALWSSALRDFPEGTVRVHNNLASALASKGRLPEATTHFRRALELSPWNADACLNLGNALYLQGRSEEAVTYLSRAVEMQPSSPDAHLFLGLSLLRAGSLEKAADQFRAVLKTRPDDLSADLNLCAILIDIGQVDEAVRRLGRLQESHSTLPQASFLLGCALLRNDELRAARTAFEAALSRDPGYLLALLALSWQLSTSVDGNGRDPQLAMKLARTAVERTSGRDARALKCLAAALAAGQQYDEAIRTALAATRLAAQSGHLNFASDVQPMIDAFSQRHQFCDSRPPDRVVDTLAPW